MNKAYRTPKQESIRPASRQESKKSETNRAGGRVQSINEKRNNTESSVRNEKSPSMKGSIASVQTFDSNICKEKKIDNYHLGIEIGHGSYAVVRSGTNKTTGQKIAIKVYEKYKLISSQRKNCVNREIKILQKFDHPNIVKLHEVIDTSRQLFLIMELVRGKSLLDYVRSKSGRKLEEPDCARLFKQIVEGINYCHTRNVAHRDIKMDNILLDEMLNVKIIDFGFSVWAPALQKLKVFCGTPSYMAPEIVCKREYFGPPADMWSLGVLLFAMLCGFFPFRAPTELELYRNISKGLFSIPAHVSPIARRAITKLLCIHPQNRPTSADVFSLNIFLVS